MTDDDRDYEPGWSGLSILLWPVSVYMRVRQWMHERLHPEKR